MPRLPLFAIAFRVRDQASAGTEREACVEASEAVLELYSLWDSSRLQPPSSVDVRMGQYNCPHRPVHKPGDIQAWLA